LLQTDVFRFSLREYFLVLFGISVSFGAGFLPARLGWFYPFVLESIIILVGMVVVFSINRLAITIGLLFTAAGTLGVLVSHSPWHLPTIVRSCIVVFAMLGIPLLFITVPLTIHRRTGSGQRPSSD
jgi:hypothetical protein